MRKFPPKGYRANEFPLPHNFGSGFGLQAEDATKAATHIPLFRMSEIAATPEAIEVNPTNALFAADGGAVIHRTSIVPKLMFQMKLSLTKGAVETDKIRFLKIKWMPIYTAFLDSLDAADEKTATDIESILALQHDTTNKDVYGLYANVKLSTSGSIPLSTVSHTEVFGDYALDTNADYENIIFSEETMYDALQFYSNAGKLRQAIGPIRSVTLTRDRPFEFTSRRFTYPTVKRGNPYTYCGIMIWLPQAGTRDQFPLAADTTAIDHINVQYRVRFDEWNNSFEQAPV